MNYIYQFINNKDEVIYIGITKDINKRLRYQHFTDKGHLSKECYNESVMIVYSECLSHDDACIKERYLINKITPKYNQIMNNSSTFKFIIDDFNWKYIGIDKTKHIEEISNYKNSNIKSITLLNMLLKKPKDNKQILRESKNVNVNIDKIICKLNIKDMKIEDNEVNNIDSNLILDIYDENEMIGCIYSTNPIEFEYTKSWLNSPNKYSLIDIPLNSGKNNSSQVESIFENLLPEGNLRNNLSISKNATSVFEMLSAAAGDNIGNLTILPHGIYPSEQNYQKSSWQEISLYFNGKLDKSNYIDNRTMISGAQRKKGICIIDGEPFFPLGISPSTHIIKPDINTITNVWGSSVNEAIIMRTAKHCGMNVANVLYEPITKSCVIERFDRVKSENGKITRLVQYDFCQLLGITSDKKYEIEGGPGIKNCVDIIKNNSEQPANDLKSFFEWVFFNIMTGNNDSHAKNLSFYKHPDNGMCLTPFYDLMCTRLYPGLSKKFAFKIGEVDIPSDIKMEHINLMAKSVGVKPIFLKDIGTSLNKKLMDSMKLAISELNSSFSPSEIIIAERLMFKVKKISNTFVNNLNNDAQVETSDEVAYDFPRQR